MAFLHIRCVTLKIHRLKTVKSHPVSTGCAGQTFLTLTTSADSFTGTAGNDTFNAANAAGTAAGQTFTVADSLNGGAGTDTLNISVGAASTYALSNVSNIEAVNGTFTAAGTLSLLGSSGVTSVTSNGSTAAAVFNNIASTSVALGVSNTDQNATFTFTTAAVAGTTDAATMTVSNQTAGTTTINGVETLSIVSTGGANTIADLTTDSVRTLNVSGDQNLAITAALDATVLTVDASSMTGGLTFNADQATAMTITGGAGNDVVTLTGTNAVNDVVNLGAGNDRVVFSANLATTDSVDGGEGTDTLMSTSALLTGYSKPATATINNFETLRVSDALGANLTAANVQTGIATVVMDAALAAARTITLEAGSRTVTQTATQAAALTVNDTGSAITDTLTLNIAATVGAVDVLSEEIVVGGFETVNVVTTTTAAATQAMGAISVTPDSGGAVALNFSGNNTVTTGVITASSATSGSVNASGLTGTASFTNAGQMVGISSVIGSANSDTIVTAATSTTVDGGAGNDAITGGAGNDNITAGAGNDTVDGAAGNDVINGGAGNDSITSGAGNDTVLGGEGNDTIIYGDNLTTGDSIDGGDGTDTLSVTNTTLTALNALTISQVVALNDRISNVERVTVSDALNQGTFDVTRIDGVTTVTLADGISGDETLGGLASGSTVIATADNAADTDILTLSLTDNTGSSDAINYTMTQAADDDYGVLSVAGIETVNITINEAVASSTVRAGTLGLTVSRSDGTNTRAVTVNISGTEALAVDTAIGADVINASGLTGAFTMSDATGSSLAQTITGGSGADSLVGGAGADVIDGGSGADSIVGGTGNDNLTGGTGADVITGGAGVDTITLTEGTASSDIVLLDFVNGGADVITGFTTGATTGDILRVDISAIEALSTAGGLHTGATDIVGLADGVSDTDETIQVMTTSAAAAADANIFVLRGTIGSASELEDALEAGGAFAISGVHANVAADDIFFAVYTNGTDAFMAAVRVAVDGNTATFSTGDLAATNIAQLVGVTSIGASTFVVGNFDLTA